MSIEKKLPPEVEALRKKNRELREQMLKDHADFTEQAIGEQAGLRNEQVSDLRESISALDEERNKSDQKLKDAGIK